MSESPRFRDTTAGHKKGASASLNPTLSDNEEYERELPTILSTAKRNSRRASRRGLDCDELLSRMYEKIHRGWKGIPKKVGQDRFLQRICTNCMADEGNKNVRRQVIIPRIDKQWAHENLRALSEERVTHTDLRSLDLVAAWRPLEELYPQYKLQVTVLLSRDVCEMEWKVVSHFVGKSVKQCQSYRKQIIAVIRERYPELKELWAS